MFLLINQFYQRISVGKIFKQLSLRHFDPSPKRAPILEFLAQLGGNTQNKCFLNQFVGQINQSTLTSLFRKFSMNSIFNKTGPTIFETCTCYSTINQTKTLQTFEHFPNFLAQVVILKCRKKTNKLIANTGRFFVDLTW